MPKRHEPFIDTDGEVRALRKGDRVKLSMLRDSFPELAAHAEKRKAGRPKVDAPKRVKSFKLSPDVIDAITTSGKGYNIRVEAALRTALAEGRI
jgi:uncharacterized protein (DUF4415 family)